MIDMISWDVMGFAVYSIINNDSMGCHGISMDFLGIIRI